ncbi:CobW family GTP-binding protein [Couchioplanes caeruleus]|uniref:CobW C-terminal domain-containing protein n=2 Tax=Couchioplanes caeruleus TaxID=56438 RepID=A0A1K0FH76_9ACTN|nr:GTP-binding protein [Couchioplanes caeruleus]OJF12181.1 hypothetical protein BG844_22100 [Couchioplanes caeruleus subsp. caeruleus]ROP28258.1 G3E family GTPase [Couchioplanes caeruleus]
MNTRAATTAAPHDLDNRARVTVVSGFSPTATLAAGEVLLRDDDRPLLLHYDISRIRTGTVRRIVRTAERTIEDTVVSLVQACVSCTLRDDVIPSLARLSRHHPGRDLLLALPEAIDPEEIATACRHRAVHGSALSDLLHVDSFVTVVDAAAFLDDLSSTDDLRDRDLHAAPGDGRSVAQVVARQVEFCDTVVIWGRPADVYQAARLTALVQRLTPWAAYVHVEDPATSDDRELAARLLRTGRHDPLTPGILSRALECRPIGVHDLEGTRGATSLLFDSRRPFHPHRLHDALPRLTGDALRGRGQLWIASQPAAVIGWETAGQAISMTSLGPWLAALPRERWHETSVLRRLAADATWDPYYGDRRTALAFIGLDSDTAALSDVLTGCLLTEAELAAGADSWSELTDPFADSVRSTRRVWRP